MILSISYGYVVEYIPSFKAPYVAASISIPLFIIALSYPAEKQLYIVTIAGFLFALGREVCMDINDRTGDVPSIIHKIDQLPLTIAAFVVQIIGLSLLIVKFNQLYDTIVIGLMALVITSSGFTWFVLKKQTVANKIMKIQMLIGLYFLI